ncbi:MAG: tyrosine-protein phosphatase [Lentisphaeria bacterium]
MAPTAVLFSILCLSLVCGAAETPQVRPGDWAQPVVGSSLDNFCRVSNELYRSEQPDASDLPALKAMGIKSVLSLRHYHDDTREFERAGLVMIPFHMDAGSVSEADLVAVLKLIQAAPKPVLVHCWHGSDRTGFVVAGYRMVIMGWAAPKAVEELRLGGFGYHESYFPKIVKILQEMDVPAVRQAVLGAPPKPSLKAVSAAVAPVKQAEPAP